MDSELLLLLCSVILCLLCEDHLQQSYLRSSAPSPHHSLHVHVHVKLVLGSLRGHKMADMDKLRPTLWGDVPVDDVKGGRWVSALVEINNVPHQCGKVHAPQVVDDLENRRF